VHRIDFAVLVFFPGSTVHTADAFSREGLSILPSAVPSRGSGH